MSKPTSAQRPARTYRITTAAHQAPLVDALLAAQGFTSESEPFFPMARRLTSEPFPLGASLAASFGLIYIQDRSSMLPPVLLAQGEGGLLGARCLDMCASPGGKTGILAQAAGPQGFVLAVEPSRDRLATLRQNLRRMNALNTATTGVESQHLPLPAECFDRILLDPPCSGWGTVDKNPKVMELWTPEKAETLVRLQRALLAKAAELLAPGGVLMFSTCTTNVRENEEQAAWALANLPLRLSPLPAPQGFTPVAPALAGVEGVLRVGEQNTDAEESGEGGQGQGFFLARFIKHGQPEQAPRHFAAAELGGRLLSPEELALAGLPSLDTLPPGEVREFGGKAFFLHRHALELGLGADTGEGTLRWQGFPLGQTTGGKEHGGKEVGGRETGGKKPGGKNLRPGKGGKDREPERGRPSAARLKLDPRLRALLPPAHALAPEQRLDVDDTAPLLDLLAGRSLGAPREASGGPTGLYFQGLPLGWLTRKGARLLWSDR